MQHQALGLITECAYAESAFMFTGSGTLGRKISGSGVDLNTGPGA